MADFCLLHAGLCIKVYSAVHLYTFYCLLRNILIPFLIFVGIFGLYFVFQHIGLLRRRGVRSAPRAARQERGSEDGGAVVMRGGEAASDGEAGLAGD